MGYATVMRVPRIADYNEAFKKWNNTKPMRGREEDKRPLGARRDADTYSIRKNVWTEAIELVLYQTPVVKFKPDGEVVVNIDRWPSASTCQFISRVLTGVGAYRVRGDVVLGFSNSVVQRIAQQEEMVLVRGASGSWQPKEIKAMFDYRINRKEANNVRKDVSQFRDYLKGMVKLMEETFVFYGQESKRITRTYNELGEVLGFNRENMQGKVTIDLKLWRRLVEKPNSLYVNAEQNQKEWVQYNEASDKFYELVKNDQDDNTRHQNYWIAFNILFAYENHIYWVDEQLLDKPLYLGAGEFEKSLDRILFARFSDRVFKLVELEKGKVPTGKYDKFVRSEV